MSRKGQPALVFLPGKFCGQEEPGGLQLIYNVVLVSGIQQSDSVISFSDSFLL